MVSFTEVKQYSDQVKGGRDVGKSKITTATNGIHKAVGSWKGETSVSFNDTYKKVQTKINKLIADAGSLSQKLNSLSLAVKREEADQLKEMRKK